MIFPFIFLAAVVSHAIDQATLHAEVITLAVGGAQVLPQATDVKRVAVTDPTIADVVVLSTREILVNAYKVGSTTLIIWDTGDVARTFTIDVTIDVGGIQRQFASLFPNEGVKVTAQGNIVILSGRVSSAGIAKRMVEIARGMGFTVIENFGSATAPPADPRP
jgi:pilus assembly protein CpaC